MATALESALNKAGIRSSEASILAACVHQLKQHPHDLSAAGEAVINSLNREHLLVLFEDFMNDALRPWFDRARKEIGGSGGPARFVAQMRSAPATAEPNGKGQGRLGPHGSSAPPRAESRAIIPTRPFTGVPAARPSTVNIASLSAVSGVVKRAYLRTFFINGKPIAEITAGEAMRWAEGRQRDARFVKALCSTLPENAVIGQSVTEDEAEAAWHVAEGWNERD